MRKVVHFHRSISKRLPVIRHSLDGLRPTKKRSGQEVERDKKSGATNTTTTWTRTTRTATRNNAKQRETTIHRDSNKKGRTVTSG